jgi:hypothetical protein
VDVAVITAVPTVLGVKTPAGVIDPPVADQVTNFGNELELYAPVPVTLAAQFAVCVDKIAVEEQLRVTDVTELLMPPQPIIGTQSAQIKRNETKVAAPKQFRKIRQPT